MVNNFNKKVKRHQGEEVLQAKRNFLIAQNPILNSQGHPKIQRIPLPEKIFRTPPFFPCYITMAEREPNIKVIDYLV